MKYPSSSYTVLVGLLASSDLTVEQHLPLTHDQQKLRLLQLLQKRYPDLQQETSGFSDFLDAISVISSR